MCPLNPNLKIQKEVLSQKKFIIHILFTAITFCHAIYRYDLMNLEFLFLLLFFRINILSIGYDFFQKITPRE